METQNPIDVAQGISNFGMMAMVCAFFLIMSALMWIACFKWFKSIINKTIQDNGNMFKSLLDETRKQNELINDISEGLRPETLLRLKNMSSVYFDYSVERVCAIIKKVKSENHIVDHEATVHKIRTLLQNLHDDRDSRFDSHTYRGKRLSSYTSPEWIDWVAEICEREVYADPLNESRMHTNITAVYDRIKIDFYHRLSNRKKITC